MPWKIIFSSCGLSMRFCAHALSCHVLRLGQVVLTAVYPLFCVIVSGLTARYKFFCGDINAGLATVRQVGNFSLKNLVKLCFLTR